MGKPEEGPVVEEEVESEDEEPKEEEITRIRVPKHKLLHVGNMDVSNFIDTGADGILGALGLTPAHSRRRAPPSLTRVGGDGSDNDNDPFEIVGGGANASGDATGGAENGHLVATGLVHRPGDGAGSGGGGKHRA